jgi:hypothetical protein
MNEENSWANNDGQMVAKGLFLSQGLPRGNSFLDEGYGQKQYNKSNLSLHITVFL